MGWSPTTSNCGACDSGNAIGDAAVRVWQSVDMVMGAGSPSAQGIDEGDVDFFVSYTMADEAWATWIGMQLEAAGQRVRLQAWDSPAGENFVVWISRQMQAAARTIAVCSPAYFDSHWCTQEWTGALADSKVIPLRVADCTLPHVLATIGWRDLHSLGETAARRRLLEAVGLAAVARVASGGFPGAPRADERDDRATEGFEDSGHEPTRALAALPPRRYTHLVGRKKEISSITAQLRSRDNDTPAIVAITGLGGIGKTALAHEVVERVLSDGIFEGLVWESAKPDELEAGTLSVLNRPELTYESLLDAIARQLGLEALTQLPPRELEARLRTVLLTKSYLIVVDNLETVEAYRALATRVHDLISPGRRGRPTRALFTSRERLVDLPYIFDYYIRGLPKQDSRVFLRQEAKDRNAVGLKNGAPKLFDEIFEITQGMPLAMKLVVSQYLLGIAIDTELERLKGAKEEELYRFLYSRLWFRLSVPAQKVLVAIAAFAASVACFMLQPVSKTRNDEFTAALVELTRMSLVEPSDHPMESQRRYSIHQMTRWFINSPLRTLWEQQRAPAQLSTAGDVDQTGQQPAQG